MTVHVKQVEEARPLPSPKRQRLQEPLREDCALPVEFVFCQQLLVTTDDQPIPKLPASLLKKSNVKTSIATLKELFQKHSFRTAVISSPRQALSLYTTMDNDSEVTESQNPGRQCLLAMLGLHENQETLELFFRTAVKNCVALLLFCHRLRIVCRDIVLEEPNLVGDLICGCELQCRSLGKMTTAEYSWTQILNHAHALSASVPRLVATLCQRIVKASPKYRLEQLRQEYQTIQICNSTLSNALVTLFLQEHDCLVQEIMFKASHQKKYERLSVYLYDPELDPYKPSNFLFLPSLPTALQHGPSVIVEQMIRSFWSHMMRQGYYATDAMKGQINEELEPFFLSGLTENTKLPLKLNAHFAPNRPLSLYLYGKAGAGKSSFVRNFQTALEATIEETLDPEMCVRFVKQNLNKPMETLRLELELRPNNNDLSIMSVIQARRMTRTQRKPGMVVVDLEEMPDNDVAANPNQQNVAQLVSQRFAGLTGDFKAGPSKPKGSSTTANASNARGIANDASVVTLITSNYELDASANDALSRLKMFQTLRPINMTAVSGHDRVQFANCYLEQCLQDRFKELSLRCELDLHIPVGEGDTRPLVRHLRMVAFHLYTLVKSLVRFGCTLRAEVRQSDSQINLSAMGQHQTLKIDANGFVLPMDKRVSDARVTRVLDNFPSEFPIGDTLSVALDFWLAKTLAPTVIVSNNKDTISALMDAVSASVDVACIRGVNAATYKIMKSLYDPNDTPNLRDDILRCGRGANVAISLECPDTDSQLCIREIIEDSPSMTAVSTTQSALYKEGLLFLVYIQGDITPEIRSRASTIV
eukprot:Nitzschia sp. Nitz4//scaffold287_size23745//7628//10152//NITZ4_008458-RA/size23745-snap-gene-0.22-mRNA-1//1//CDS//3329545763//6039//frame0